MKLLVEYVNYLFNCSFIDETFDPDGKEDHLKTSWKLLDEYSWEDIYQSLMKHLHIQCKTPYDVINFVNLYYYYNFMEHPINDPIEFISYLYYMVDIDKFWDEAGDLFDSITIDIFSRQGLIDLMIDPYYNPLKDERILEGIENWKSGKFKGPTN